MLAYHRRLLHFDHWASLASLAAVEPASERVPVAVSRLCHIIGAKRIWLARVEGSPMPFSVNPTFTVPEIHAQLNLAHDGWMRFLDLQSGADVERVVSYTNLKGEPFRSALGDILAHLALHGQQHRGQINADLRAAGLEPPTIDFIHAARSGALDAH